MTAALVLAGGSVPEKERAAWEPLLPPGTLNRALLDIDGKPMVRHVVEAIQAAIDGPVLVAGDVPTPPGCRAAPGGASMIDTLLGGVAALGPEHPRLLVATADIPFLTPDAVRDVLNRADAVPGAAFVYPIVEAARCRERFPQMKRTTLRLADGEFTGGNVVVLSTDFLRAREEVLRDAYAARKNVPRLARLLGPDILLRLIASRLVPSVLTIGHLEGAVSRVLGGARVRAIVTPYPEIGADIDHPDDARALGR